MDMSKFGTEIKKDLPILFVKIGWTLFYDGTEAVIGKHRYLQDQPSETTEGHAFTTGAEDHYSCGIGRGKILEDRLHVVFVARDPHDRLLKVVGIYADAETSARQLRKNAKKGTQPWVNVKSKNVILLPMPGRPVVSDWGGQGMRRWAKRSLSTKTAHPSLETFFEKLKKTAFRSVDLQTTISTDGIDEESSALEGEPVHQFVTHRTREGKLRRKKIAMALRENQNRLVCEVPNCGFDFVSTYGNLGFGYAHVHHLLPLGKAEKHGQTTKLSDLAIVCANCHSMIHKGGECRPLVDLIPKKKVLKK